MRVVVVFVMGNRWRVAAAGILHRPVHIMHLVYQTLFLQAPQHPVHGNTVAQTAEPLLQIGMRQGYIRMQQYFLYALFCAGISAHHGGI